MSGTESHFDWAQREDSKLRRRSVAICVIAAAILVTAMSVGCQGRKSASLVVVSGRTLVYGTAEGTYVALYESSLPLEYFVQEQAFGSYTGETAEGSSNADGRFTLQAHDLDEESATRLILYATCERLGCSAPGGCVYRALPPLTRDGERWVVKSTGRPLRVTLRIGVDQPSSPCY
jgi:hypothetical protein